MYLSTELEFFWVIDSSSVCTQTIKIYCFLDFYQLEIAIISLNPDIWFTRTHLFIYHVSWSLLHIKIEIGEKCYKYKGHYVYDKYTIKVLVN